ncbi:shikimate dehydrogenase [Paenibacillus sp. CAA11]|uniref:shikimate dehydrogenase n=1 Tax=Paenibacillus sp. CAA11 TaxID=1532905 RepID=UPI000D366630|nr:shikimate dehydrogenase [Paenibacillus sp. CAA11]AWB45464.1 shikimate dehydrogenase [Paenibacillus sp. CAA11]
MSNLAVPVSSSGSMLLGVMGDPIAHSKSPVMHQAALRQTGIPGDYVRLHITADQLGEAILSIRTLGFRGVNVTVPHKVKVMAFLDEIDPAAAAVGAVNTIVNNNGRLTGYNTDGIGYIRSLKEEAVPELSGKTVVVLGAGGAARGVIHALLTEGPRTVIVANRTKETASKLCEEWQKLGSLEACSLEELSEWVPQADVVINTTSVGMSPRIEESPLDTSLLPGGTVVSDLIYNPLKTRLLREAELRGCRIHSGLGMFVYQGAYAFEYWTGQPAPIPAMRNAVLEQLDGQE